MKSIWVSLPKSPIHPYVILPCTFRQRKWKEVSPERVVLHPRATKMRDSVAQACRAALSGDEKCGFRCRRVPLILTSFCLAPLGNENGWKCCLNVSYCTLGRRKVWVSLPKSPFILTSFCPTPTGNKNGRKCRLNVSCRTLGQRKCATVLPKRAALHPRATKMGVGVAQACRAVLSGDEKCGFRCRGVPFILTSFCPTPTGNKNGRKCRLNVSYCTLGRRKSAKVSPKSAALHSRATKSVGFVAEESPLSLRHSALHPRATKMDGSVA